MAKLFDIYCEDDNRRQSLEKFYKIKMKEAEMSFLKDQQNERKMYSTDSIDRKWQKTMERKLKQEKTLEMMKEKEQEAKESLLREMEANESRESHTEDDNDSDSFEDDQKASEVTFKRRKLSAIEHYPDSMPECFKHIRKSINVVRPEFYSTVDLLISKYHCSKVQAVAGVIEIGKLMFDRNWKYHTEDTACLDLDTAPHNKNIRRAGQAIHAFSLGCLVEEIMESEDGAVITYHTDGSRAQGVGSYTVQGITINGRYRSLPALPISNECRANLAHLKATVLSILSIVSGMPTKTYLKKFLIK